MSEQIILDVEDRHQLEDLAQSRGFNTVQDYLLALVAADLDDDEDEDYDLEEGLREAFRDIREGRTYPIESLWDMIEAEDDKD